MKLKKVLFMVLAGICLFALVGCGGNTETPPADNSGASDKDKAAKKVVVGTSASYYPWAHQEKDELQGFEIDVWNEIAKRNNYELEFKLSKFSGLIGMLDAGQIDTIAHQMSITEERSKKYDFSSTYAYSYYDFAVKNDSPIKSVNDLKGKKVGCWLGGNGEVTLRDNNEKLGLNLDIVTYDGVPIETEVELGRIDAAWQGEIKTLTTIKDNNLPLRLIGERLTFEVNAYPFLKNETSKALAAEVGTAIDAMRADGTLLALSKKWFDLDTITKPAE